MRVNHRPLWVGAGLLVFCVLGILINRRPLGDIVLMVLGGLVVVWLAGCYIGEAMRNRAAERARQRDAAVKWEMYSRPILGQSFHEVGVERVTEHGRMLNRERAHKIPRGDSQAILEAEGEMILRATDYNERGTER